MNFGCLGKALVIVEYKDWRVEYMKRLAIFVFYDKDGIADDYVIYILSELRKCVTDLIIVANGILQQKSQEKLAQFTGRIYIRENKGFDAMAYKLAMTDYVGWNDIMQYDEVVLTNDTYYGPIYPFQEVFDHMQNNQADFWGLTCQRESVDYFSYNQKVIPANIQSFFWVFRKSLLKNRLFQDYWNHFDSTEWIFSDVVNKHERIFTKKISDMGFTCDTYVKEPVFESKLPEQNFNQYFYIAYQLIKNQRCPIIKRKAFIRKHLTESYGGTGEDIMRALHFIKEHTSYDTDMIWDNLLRLYDVSEIHKTLNLNYILQSAKNTNYTGRQINAAAIIWISTECCLDECRNYLMEISSVLDVFLLSDSEQIIQKLSMQMPAGNVQYELVPEVSTDELHNCLLKKAQEIIEKYDYIVFLYDIDYEHTEGAKLSEYSKFRNIWSNLAADRNYISEVIHLFESNTKLGVLTVPKLVTGTAFGALGSQWCGTLDSVKELLQQIGVLRNIPDNAECLNECHAFWCRTEILKSYVRDLTCLPQYKIEVVAKIYPYIAQACGYYTGTVMNNISASVTYTNMQEILTRILTHTCTKYGFTDFDSYLDGDVLEYCRKFSQIMVYGAGENGYRIACLLKDHGLKFSGYIVSDGQPHTEKKYGDTLITLSQLPRGKADLGIVVCVTSPKFQSEIIENLYGHGYRNIYVI